MKNSQSRINANPATVQNILNAMQTAITQFNLEVMQRYPDDLLVHDKSTEKPHQVYLAATKLGWTPKISFDELVAEMVREDLKSAERDELFKKHGYKAMDYHE